MVRNSNHISVKSKAGMGIKWTNNSVLSSKRFSSLFLIGT